MTPWSKQEDTLLIASYERYGFARTAKNFSWRSSMALRARIKVLHLSDPKYSNPLLKKAFVTWYQSKTKEPFEIFIEKHGVPPSIYHDLDDQGHWTFTSPEKEEA